MNFRAGIGILLMITGAVAVAVQSESQAQSQAQTSGLLRVAKITGTIDPATSNFLSTTIERAQKGQDQAVLVELDTPGGLISSVREMAQTIDRSAVPVIVYVTPAGASATSAGALLALASHLAVMSPGSNIGAATPVDSSGKDIPGAMGEKVMNDTAAFARGLAEVRGRNRDLAERVVSKAASLTAQEALAQDLIELVAADRADLLKQIDGRELTVKSGDGKPVVKKLKISGVIETEMSLGQKLLHFLANPNVAALLMSIGVMLIYAEISTAGVGIAGALGAICLIVAFMTFQTLPIRAGGLVLIILGILFMVAEAFVTTKGALALGGALSFGLGMIWIFDPAQTHLRVSPAVWIPILLAMGGGAVGVGWLASKLKRDVERARAEIGGGADSGLAGYPATVESVSADGRSGKASIRGETWDFRSDQPCKVGQNATVSGVRGMTALLTFNSKENKNV